MLPSGNYGGATAGAAGNVGTSEDASSLSDASGISINSSVNIQVRFLKMVISPLKNIRVIG